MGAAERSRRGPRIRSPAHPVRHYEAGAPLVADTQNYGDEAGASALLHPQRFELMGVPDEDFLLRRDKEEMKSILECADIHTQHFDMLFDTAVQLFDDGKELVSLDAYLYVTSNLINDQVAKRENEIPPN